jgi:hypothetical protein
MLARIIWEQSVLLKPELVHVKLRHDSQCARATKALLSETFAYGTAYLK